MSGWDIRAEIENAEIDAIPIIEWDVGLRVWFEEFEEYWGGTEGLERADDWGRIETKGSAEIEEKWLGETCWLKGDGFLLKNKLLRDREVESRIDAD